MYPNESETKLLSPKIVDAEITMIPGGHGVRKYGTDSVRPEYSGSSMGGGWIC